MNDTQAYFDRLPESDLRRGVLKGLLAIGVGGASLGAFTRALAAAPADTVAELTMLVQAGPVGDAIKSIANPEFARSFPKAKVELSASTNAAAYPKMLAQRNNPAIGGGMFNDLFSARGTLDKMWVPMNPEFVTNARNVPEQVRIPGGLGITIQQTPFGIMYNPDRVPAPTSWTDLWNPKYRGRVAMWDSYFDAYAMASVATGGSPSVEAGIKAWAPHKDNIGAWTTGTTSEQDMVHRGEMWLAPHWGGWAEQARLQGKNVRFVIPAEGATLWSNQIHCSTGFSPLLTELIQRYLNTWLSTEIQTAWMKDAVISPAVTTVQIPDELKSNQAIVQPSQVGGKLIRLDATYVAQNFNALKSQIDRSLKG